MSEGTLLIGQSGGATAVIGATLAGAIDAAHDLRSFDRILGMRDGVDGLLNERFVDLTALEPARRNRLRMTPGAALGTSRIRVSAEDLDRAAEILVRHRVTGVVLIGGNDSADSALRLHQRMGKQTIVALAPKTVDNDLEGTAFCPGFPSAARCLATLVRDATWDSLSAPKLYPAKVIEVPGRDAGWLPLAGSLGFAERDQDVRPLVFVPEAPPASVDAMVAALEARIATNGFVVAIVPETLRDASGRHLGGDDPEYVDPFGHPYFPSAGEALARAMRARIGVRVRVERPGSAIRMASALASPVDRDVAYMAGRIAATATALGHGGIMAGVEAAIDDPLGIGPWNFGWVPLGGVANRVRGLPRAYFDDQRFAATDDFVGYALPLLGPEPFLPYERLDTPRQGV